MAHPKQKQIDGIMGVIEDAAQRLFTELFPEIPDDAPLRLRIHRPTIERHKHQPTTGAVRVVFDIVFPEDEHPPNH